MSENQEVILEEVDSEKEKMYLIDNIEMLEDELMYYVNNAMQIDAILKEYADTKDAVFAIEQIIKINQANKIN